MKRKKFIIPIAAVLASMTVLLTACGTSSGGGSDSENVKTVKIAYLPITHALPVYELSQSDNVKSRTCQIRFMAGADGCVEFRSGRRCICAD